MSEAFIGEIRMFAANFAPRSWAFCSGQLLAISQNDALFSLLGTIYGGDGRTTFALPDLRGRVPLHRGNGPGLTPRTIGQRFGVERVTLTSGQLPVHSHELRVLSDAGDSTQAEGRYLAASPNVRVYRPVPPNVNLSASVIANQGGSQQHSNMMPFQCVNFIICLFGIFPSRT